MLSKDERREKWEPATVSKYSLVGLQNCGPSVTISGHTLVVTLGYVKAMIVPISQPVKISNFSQKKSCY